MCMPVNRTAIYFCDTNRSLGAIVKTNRVLTNLQTNILKNGKEICSDIFKLKGDKIFVSLNFFYFSNNYTRCRQVLFLFFMYIQIGPYCKELNNQILLCNRNKSNIPFSMSALQGSQFCCQNTILDENFVISVFAGKLIWAKVKWLYLL